MSTTPIIDSHTDDDNVRWLELTDPDTADCVTVKAGADTDTLIYQLRMANVSAAPVTPEEAAG